jgi:hypothetical protein
MKLSKMRTIVIAVILVGVMAFGVSGYWTNTLNLNGTFKAAKMDVIFVNPCVASELSPYIHADAVISADKKTVDFKIENMYPGAMAKLNVTAQNVGTIPVKLDNVVLTTDNDVLAGYLQCYGYVGYKNPLDVIHTQNLSAIPFNILNLDTLLNSNVMLDTMVLQPNGQFYFSSLIPGQGFYIKLDDNAPGMMQGQEVTVSMTIDWKQFNQ